MYILKVVSYFALNIQFFVWFYFEYVIFTFFFKMRNSAQATAEQLKLDSCAYVTTVLKIWHDYF